LRESGRIVREDIDMHGREIFRGGWKNSASLSPPTP
jgi:hypothetical protein